MPGGTINAAGMARKFDYWIQKRGKLVSIYHAQRTRSGGVVTEQAVTLAGTTYAMIQFGKNAQDQANEVGVDPSQAAVAYFLSSAVDIIVQRAWVVDGNDLWLIESKPNVQQLEAVVGVSALLLRQVDKPAGIP